MAFLRHATAIVVHPRATPAAWSKTRMAAKVTGQPSQGLAAQASEILGRKFDPEDYLLTHCTIVASVEVEDVPGVKLGSVKEGGRKIQRKYGNYRVSASTDQYINNNLDCFGRAVLLKSYRTFIGGHNFLEHVQIEDQSKGRIIDAVTRDIGDSIYVDILVATDRKFTDLVADIENGRLGTLSMGCSVEETICTKCGNVAVDETELCNCIKYAKGNIFLDERGKRHRIAELCGHETIDPTGGVTFIEGSWVASPAFTGAVMRNIITPAEMSPRVARRIQEVMSTPPAEWVDQGGQRKAASEVLIQDAAVVGRVSDRKAGFDFGDPGADEGGGEAAPAPAAPAPSKLDDLEDSVMDAVTQRVLTRVRDELDKKNPKPVPEASVARMNDSLQASVQKVARRAYAASVEALVKTATCEADVVNKVAVLDASFGSKVPVDVYRTALTVGSIRRHDSPENFLRTCRDVLGRSFGPNEAAAFIRLGRILSHAEAALRPPSTPDSKSNRSLS